MVKNKLILGLSIILVIFGLSLLSCQFITKNCNITTSSIWNEGVFNGLSSTISNFGFSILILLLIISIIYLIRLGVKK